MSKLFTLPKQVVLTNAGELIPGALAYFYEAGTATPLSVYTERTLTTPHANPVVADGYGRFPTIYYDPADDYKVKITDADGVEIYSQDYAASTLTPEEVGAALYPLNSVETAASVTPSNYSLPYYYSNRYASLDDWLSVIVTGTVVANPTLTLSWGATEVTSALSVVDSGGQWGIVGEGGRARSNSLQASAALDDAKMLSLTNVREVKLQDIEFLGTSGSEPSHGIYIDRDSASQTGSGGPGKIHFNRLLFRNVDTGVEIFKSGTGGNNDELDWEYCYFGSGLAKWGIKLTATNSTWNNILQCRFDGVGLADVCTAVPIGEDRGGSFQSIGCKHISGKLAYLIGDCRFADISGVLTEQHDNLIWSSAKYLEATDISITGTDTFNSAAGEFPTVAAGDLVWTLNHTTAANDGVYLVTGTPSTSAIQVTEIDGSAPGLTNDSAGASVLFAPTKMLQANAQTTSRLNATEVRTTDPHPIVWDGDDPEHVLVLSGHFALVGGDAVNWGSATMVFGPGRYQVGEIITDDGDVHIMPGAVFTAGGGTPTLTVNGTGSFIDHRYAADIDASDNYTVTGIMSLIQSGGAAGDYQRWRDSTDSEDLVVRYDGDDWTFRSENNGGGNLYAKFKGSGDGGVEFGGSIKSGTYMQMRTETATNIADVSNAVNTDNGKVAGAMIWDSTNSKIKIATGNADADTWVDADGTNAVTPT